MADHTQRAQEERPLVEVLEAWMRAVDAEMSAVAVRFALEHDARERRFLGTVPEAKLWLDGYHTGRRDELEAMANAEQDDSQFVARGHHEELQRELAAMRSKLDASHLKIVEVETAHQRDKRELKRIDELLDLPWLKHNRRDRIVQLLNRNTTLQALLDRPITAPCQWTRSLRYVETGCGRTIDFGDADRKHRGSFCPYCGAWVEVVGNG